MKNNAKQLNYIHEMKKDIMSVTEVYLNQMLNDDEVTASDVAHIIMSVFSYIVTKFCFMFNSDKEDFLEAMESCYDYVRDESEQDDD